MADGQTATTRKRGGAVWRLWKRQRMRAWRVQLGKWLRDDAAVTSIEYALISVLIAVVIVGAVTGVGLEVKAAFDYVASCVVNLQCP